MQHKLPLVRWTGGMTEMVVVCRYDGTVLAALQRIIHEDYVKRLVIPSLAATDICFDRMIIGRYPTIEDAGNITRLPPSNTTKIEVGSTIAYSCNTSSEMWDAIIRPDDTDDRVLKNWVDLCLLSLSGVEV